MFGKFAVDSSARVRTGDFDPNDTLGLGREGVEAECARLEERLAELQEALYAARKHALLIVLQGMDCSGKDGAVKKLLSGVNPNGFRVEAFKTPTPEELGHDYLWRVHRKTPPKGEIAVFNRSYYEDVLITRVHGLIDEDTASRRFQEIRNFEEYLIANGTVLVKFFLHISRDFQKEKLMERLKNPEKNWKFSESDLTEREKWDEYQKCYSDVLSHSGSGRAPWHVVPSNHRWFRDYFILHTVVAALEKLPLEYPVIQGNLRELIRQVEESD
jgi:PPK2 family polyphosphate:nucleotide phosphotransferase